MLTENLETSELSEVLLALEELRGAIENLQISVPAPMVFTDPPDLSEIVTAVNGLRPGVTGDEIADALARKLKFPEPIKDDSIPLLIDVIRDMKEKLDFRLQGLGRAFGSAATLNTGDITIGNDVSDRGGRILGNVTVTGAPASLAQDSTLMQVRDYLDTVETKLQSLIDKDFATQATLATRSSEATLATRSSEATLATRASEATLATRSSEATLLDVKRGLSDFEARLDYDVRTDGNPVYVGKAANGTATTAGTWTIQKLTYDASSRLTRAQVLVGIWNDRASLAW